MRLVVSISQIAVDDRFINCQSRKVCQMKCDTEGQKFIRYATCCGKQGCETLYVNPAFKTLAVRDVAHLFLHRFPDFLMPNLARSGALPKAKLRFPAAGAI